MNYNNGHQQEEIEVSDDEKYTDKKIKRRILNAREELNRTQNKLYSSRLVEPDVDYSEIEALMAWGNLVRSFIRDISVLLRHDDVEDSKYYREEIELGQIRLVPQDQDGYPFSKIDIPKVSESKLKREMGLSKDATLPKPETVDITGLMGLLETDGHVEKQWFVVTNPRAPDPEQDIVQTFDQRVIPKSVYEKALMAADEFLQNAGIGLDLSEDGVPEFGFEEVHDE